jgi:ribosome biogenesis protein NSA1
MAHSSGLLASVSLDRFARIHSTFPLPTEPGKQQEKRGQVIEKFYVQTTPTVIVWDEVADSIRGEQEAENDDDEDDDVWNLMEDAGHESGSRSVTGQGKRKKRRVG